MNLGSELLCRRDTNFEMTQPKTNKPRSLLPQRDSQRADGTTSPYPIESAVTKLK
jgi:hypothetical protein